MHDPFPSYVLRVLLTHLSDGHLRIVGKEVHLVHANGTVLYVGQNNGGSIKSPTSPAPALESGWVAHVDWVSSLSTPISSFTTTWSVPPNPPSWDNQLLYLFNSLVPPESGAILQPVLQYGVSPAGGGQYWSVASWYVTGSDAFFTNLVTVSPGQSLTGVLTLTSSSGSSFNYASSFSNIAGTSFALTGSEELKWATETLEVYGVAKLSDYPTGSTVFSNINLRTSAGAPSMAWSVTSDPSDGITTTVNVNGATNGKVTIAY